MWIMVAGPYSTGARSAADRRKNLAELNRAAAQLLSLGHVPVIGVNMALPIIEEAGGHLFDAIMMPLALALAERCDAVLRIGGPSDGADREVAAIAQRGGSVFRAIADVPHA